MLRQHRILELLIALALGVVASLGITILAYPDQTSRGAFSANAPCGKAADITNVSITGVTSTTAVVAWQTSLATTPCLDLDSAILSVFTTTWPISQSFQGVAYAPGEYDAHLAWIDRAKITDTIISDVRAITAAHFNAIVLYLAGPTSGTIHYLDRIVLDEAGALDLPIEFRLEWYDPPSFDWEPRDCDAILDHYAAYLDYFNTHSDRPRYFLLNMPLDDPSILDTTPGIAKQRAYVAYCAAAVKARIPGATVFANTYYGWRDELHQAPVGDLVDGVSVVVYAQHAADAPYSCTGIPSASDPAANLICKDQFDYYLDKAWSENQLALSGKPLVLDSTGFAPAASFANPAQMNGIVADSWAKVRAIQALRRSLALETRLRGWSYFKLLHKEEADWGLLDRRRLVDPSVSAMHTLTVSDLFPGLPYTFTLQAGDMTSGVYTFTTATLPPDTNVSPLVKVTWPAYGHALVPAGGQLAITWQDDDPDDNAVISLHYDADDAGCDGQLIVDGLFEDGPQDVYTWTLPATLPTGSYYVYARIDDGRHPAECDYSSGRFVPSTETLEVVDTGSVVTVDGMLSESVWLFAQPLVYAVHAAQTDVTTVTLRSVWIQDYLYLGFDVEDKQVETSAPESLWDSDSVSAIFSNGEFKCRQDVGGTGEGECVRALSIPSCTKPNDEYGIDCGFTAEMRILWSKLRITANVGDVLPADMLSVDHDGNPGAPYNDPGTEFSKLSWDGDNNVDTSGRSLTLVRLCDRWPCVFLPAVVKAWP